jgi:hypothetical protein
MFGRYDNKVFVRNRYECVRRSFGRLRNAVSLTFPDRSAIIKTNDSPDAQTVCVGQPTEGYLEPVRLDDTEAVREFITGSDKPVAYTRLICDALAGADNFVYTHPCVYANCPTCNPEPVPHRIRIAIANARADCASYCGDNAHPGAHLCPYHCPDCDSTSQYRSVVL